MGDYLVPGLLTLVIIVGALVLMAVGWRNRRRRQSALGPLPVPPAELGVVAHVEDALYLATTIAEKPLERIAVGGLGFRANARVTVAASGILLEPVGESPIFIATDALDGAGLATWAIDRVVETDGLVFVRWRLGNSASDSTSLDTYLRSTDPRGLVAAVAPLLPAPAPASSADSTPESDDTE